MITNLKFFDDVDDLGTLTGLNHNQLWDAGFNLDDMDWGFVSDKEYTFNKTDEYGYEYSEIKYNIPQFAEQILRMMENYCMGFYHVEYGEKHYYTLHHA